MKKQAFRLLTVLVVVVMAAFVSVTTLVNAQSFNRITSDIPFQFFVGDKALPAGEYRVMSTTQSGTAVLVQSKDGHHSATRLTSTNESKANIGQAKMIFHRYGNKYYLAQVWSGSDTGRELTKSRGERAIERELAQNPSKNEMAKKESGPEIITIMARLQ